MSFLDYQQKPLVITDVSEANHLMPYYSDCIVLPDGKVLHMQGSHDMTAAKYFNVVLEEMPMHDYGCDHFVRNKGIIAVHSWSWINWKTVTLRQLKTLKKLLVRDVISRDVYMEIKKTYEDQKWRKVFPVQHIDVDIKKIKEANNA